MENNSEDSNQPDNISNNLQNEYPVIFTGSAIEYFGIWFSNICLTIITIGIYGPWAKVRREKYFYTHTSIDGSSFDYVAKPRSILKGRIIALMAFGALSILGKFDIITSFYTYLLFSLIYPWIFNQSLRFKCRNTSFRNISFSFSGTFKKTILYAVVLKILGFLSLAILAPWSKHQLNKYTIDNIAFGKTFFKMGENKFKPFYLAYLPQLPFFIIAAAFLVITVRAKKSTFSIWDSTYLDPSTLIVLFNFGVVFFILASLATRILVSNATWDKASLGKIQINLKIPVKVYLWVTISNFIIRIFSLGLASPYCAVRMYRFKIKYLSLSTTGKLSRFMVNEKKQIDAYGDEIGEAFDLDADIGF